MISPRCLTRLAVVTVSALLGSCVTPVSLQDQAVAPTYAGPGTLLVAVIDERPSVLKEGKPPSFMGHAHVSFGIPVDMHVYPWLTKDSTDKNETLARALEDRIVVGMKDHGWKAIAADLKSVPSADQIPQLLHDQGADRLLVIRLTEWFVSVNLNWVGKFDFDCWGVAITVSGSQGHPTLGFSDAGTDVVDLESKQSPANSIRLAYRARLTKILERPELQAALRAPLDTVQQ